MTNFKLINNNQITTTQFQNSVTIPYEWPTDLEISNPGVKKITTASDDEVDLKNVILITTIKQALEEASNLFCLSSNTKNLRTQFCNIVTIYLKHAIRNKTIFDYHVVCDETNNTPNVIDSNQFVGDIFIKPSLSENFIQLNFKVTNARIGFSEFVGSF